MNIQDKIISAEHRPLASGPLLLRLPIPPSLNNCFVNGAKGRFKSNSYKRWLDAAGLQLNAQRPKRFASPVDILISIKNPVSRSDIDNRVKPLLDLLVRAGVIPTDDDSIVRKITAQWSDVSGCVVEIVPAQKVAA